jgi:hypothetical protein
MVPIRNSDARLYRPIKINTEPHLLTNCSPLIFQAINHFELKLNIRFQKPVLGIKIYSGYGQLQESFEMLPKRHI